MTFKIYACQKDSRCSREFQRRGYSATTLPSLKGHTMMVAYFHSWGEFHAILYLLTILSDFAGKYSPKRNRSF